MSGNTGKFTGRLRHLGMAMFVVFGTNQAIGAGESSNAARPNIILINLDDADSSLLTDRMLQKYYPHINQLAFNGIRFTNFHITTPFCGPSRACLMTGQYAFNHGVKCNDPDDSRSNGFTGGYGEFVRRGFHQNELGVWMRSTGYRTMHVGKYHHHDFDWKAPPGWSDFSMSLGTKYFGGFRFSNEDFPDGLGFHTAQDEYVTDLDGNEAIRMIQSHDTAQPIFLYIAPIAPHSPASGNIVDMVDFRKYADFASGEKIIKDLDWNETDVSDKPAELQFPPLTPTAIARSETEHISRVRALKSVDDMVGNVVDALKQADLFENSIIFFTSDNGFQLGHHRMRNKHDPFERTSRVPLFVSGPGIPAGVTANHLLAHIDLCPTILELAEISIPSSVDGKSFAPLLTAPNQHEESSWQDSIMIENWNNKFNFETEFSACYVALRFYDSIFVSWASGAKEFYDLAADPLQLANLYGSLTAESKQNLKDLTAGFRTRNTQPIATLINIDSTRVASDLVFVEGMAEDDSRVAKVGVVIKSLTSGQYYNGQAWQNSWTRLSAVTWAKNQPVSNWSLLTNVQLPDGIDDDFLFVGARAIDANGNFGSVAWTVKPIDQAPPTAKIDPSLRGKRFLTSRATLFGTSSDNFEILSVRIVIRNIDRHYWTGNAWVDQWSFVEADLDPAGTWQFQNDFSNGFYTVTARAMDSAFNWQQLPATSYFTVAN